MANVLHIEVLAFDVACWACAAQETIAAATCGCRGGLATWAGAHHDPRLTAVHSRVNDGPVTREQIKNPKPLR